jgi:hypothetical protein
MRPNVLRPKDRSLRGGKLVKLFTDYHALERVLSRISTANPPEGTVKRLSDALVQELDFTTANAWAYAKTVLKRHSTDSPACVAANAVKLTGDWLGMTQSGVVGGYMESTSYKWNFRSDLTFEFRKEIYRSYMSPFGSGFSSNPPPQCFFGVWAPSDEATNEFEVITIDRSNALKKLSVKWLDQAMFMPRSCRIDGRDYARQ